MRHGSSTPGPTGPVPAVLAAPGRAPRSRRPRRPRDRGRGPWRAPGRGRSRVRGAPPRTTAQARPGRAAGYPPTVRPPARRRRAPRARRHAPRGTRPPPRTSRGRDAPCPSTPPRCPGAGRRTAQDPTREAAGSRPSGRAAERRPRDGSGCGPGPERTPSRAGRPAHRSRGTRPGRAGARACVPTRSGRRGNRGDERARAAEGGGARTRSWRTAGLRRHRRARACGRRRRARACARPAHGLLSQGAWPSARERRQRDVLDPLLPDGARPAAPEQRAVLGEDLDRPVAVARADRRRPRHR